MIEARAKQRRFYNSVSVGSGNGGFSILLDQKPVRTPGRKHLSLPTPSLAKAIAREWSAQSETIRAATMPLTRIANTVIDGIAGAEQHIRDDIAAFAASDLLCYRAGNPQGLVAAQRETWDPLLAWAAADLGAPFAVTSGIVHVTQPEAVLMPVRERLASEDAWALGALHVITTLTGSALLTLAHRAGRLTAEEAWAAAHVDEDWQISQWGEDTEAAARRAKRRDEMIAAASLLALSRA